MKQNEITECKKIAESLADPRMSSELVRFLDILEAANNEDDHSLVAKISEETFFEMQLNAVRGLPDRPVTLEELIIHALKGRLYVFGECALPLLREILEVKGQKHAGYFYIRLNEQQAAAYLNITNK